MPCSLSRRPTLDAGKGGEQGFSAATMTSAAVRRKRLWHLVQHASSDQRSSGTYDPVLVRRAEPTKSSNWHDEVISCSCNLAGKAESWSTPELRRAGATEPTHGLWTVRGIKFWVGVSNDSRFRQASPFLPWPQAWHVRPRRYARAPFFIIWWLDEPQEAVSCVPN